jgi:DnaK suppressor protein
MDESATRALLEQQRIETLARIKAMQSDLDGIISDSVNSNADDEHDPEGSTIAFERAQVTALLAGARSNLDDLDQALVNLSAGHYAACEDCGGQIAPERLVARPATRICIECAMARPSR